LADFLANDQKRNGGKVVVQLAHDLAQDGRIAHASVENPHRRWHWLQVFELHPNPLSNDPLLTAGRDEEEAFLAVFQKSQRRCCRFSFHVFVPLYECTVYIWL